MTHRTSQDRSDDLPIPIEPAAEEERREGREGQAGWQEQRTSLDPWNSLAHRHRLRDGMTVWPYCNHDMHKGSGFGNW